MFGSGGINYSVLRAIQSNLENQKEVKSIIAGCFLPPLIISSLVTLIYYLLIGPTIRFLDSYSVGIGMHYIMPGVFFFSINKVLLYGVFNGLNRMKIFSIYQSLRYILILISLIICFY